MEAIPQVSATKLFGLVVFGSIVIFQMAYILLQWLYVRREEYLYYAAYMAFGFLYGLEEFENYMPFSVFTRIDPNFHWHFFHALPIFCVLIYYHFSTTFLDLKHTEPALNRWVTRLKALLLAYVLFELVSNFAGLPRMTGEYIFRGISLIILISSILFIWFVWQRRNTLIRFAMAGAAFLLFGSFGSLILLVMETNGAAIPFDPFLPMLVGVIAELLTFTTGLTYKSRLVERQKLLVEQQLAKEREIQELEKANAVLETQKKERERVARELHDDLGAGITSIRLLSEVAKQKMSKEIPRAEIEQISESASGLIDDISEIIWTMNTQNDTLENTITYIRSYTGNYLQSSGLKHHIQVTDGVPKAELKSEVRRNIFLTVKEALHNVVKHAEATSVKVDIAINHKMQITIADNGKGFKSERREGMGLKSMRTRMHTIGGSFEIAGDSNGTTVKIEYSLS